MANGDRRVCFFRWLTFFLAVFSVVCATAFPADAQDYVVTKKGKLSDRDFYRLISCGATPGGKCRFGAYRWTKGKRSNITIGIVEIEEGFPSGLKRKIDKAIDQALAEINNVGSEVRIVRTTGKPDIRVTLTVDALKTKMRKPGSLTQHVIANGAIAMVRFTPKRGTRNIESAEVFYTTEIRGWNMRSIVLEEILQGLGLPMDIHNRYYEGKSIFSETKSGVKRLRGQDAKVLLYHYPPK